MLKTDIASNKKRSRKRKQTNEKENNFNLKGIINKM